MSDPVIDRALPSWAVKLVKCSSFEATLPTEAELSEARNFADAEVPLYLSAPPGASTDSLVAAAKRARLAGFEPVPHIAARNYADRALLKDMLERISGEAEVREVLVLAGDVDRAAGPFAGANAIIESDLLQHCGIGRIGISGYPDGHPKLSEEALNGALRSKLSSASARSLDVHIVSQFCFDADRIVAWVRGLRAAGVDVPVKIGLAGPTSVRGLTRYAIRCGVRTSLKAVISGGGLQLLGDVTPDSIIRELADNGLARTSLHFYSFGGLARTTRWARDFSHGALAGAPR